MERGSHPFKAVNGQKLRVAKSIFVAVPMNAAIGHPRGATGVAIGAQTSLPSDEAERVERREPVKPLRRIGSKRQLALRWANNDIGPSRCRGDEGKHVGPSSC